MTARREVVWLLLHGAAMAATAMVAGALVAALGIAAGVTSFWLMIVPAWLTEGAVLAGWLRRWPPRTWAPGTAPFDWNWRS